jgi:fibronectin-binding autotransporter adhesin
MSVTVRTVSLTSILIFLAVLSWAGGVVNSPDEQSLRAALTGGGSVTFGVDGAIAVTSPLVISNNTSIDATGHSVVITGSNAVQIFQVTSGIQLGLLNLTIANGRSNHGGAVYNQGSLTASNCTFSGNAAIGATGLPGYGGAIYNSNNASATLFASAINGNVAGGGAPVVGANGGDAFGGAIYSEADITLTINNCAFNGNVAGGANGMSQGGGPGSGYGGGLYNTSGSVMITASTFTNNAGVSGTESGVRANPYSRTGQGGAIYNASGGLTIANSSFSGNYAGGSPASGGAIHNASGTLSISNSVIVNNSAPGYQTTISYISNGGYGHGGGVLNGGTATIIDCTVSFNHVSGGPGDAATGGAGSGGDAQGAGIWNSGSIQMSRSTIAGNGAIGGNGGRSFPSGGQGGPVYGGGIYSAVNQARLINCTIVGNSIVGGNGNEISGSGGQAYGGGVCCASGSTLVTNCTIVANSVLGGKPALGSANTNRAGAFGGNIAQLGTVQMVNTILSAGVSNNASGTITDFGHNLSSDGSAGFSGSGSHNNTDPGLGAFGSYGGPTLTFPLLRGSPAIDAGDSASSPSTDQRGHSRSYGSAADIGAYESSPPYVVIGSFLGLSSTETATIVLDGGFMTNIPSGHSFRLDGLSAGAHNLSAASGPQSVIAPNPLNLTLGPDVFDANFAAFSWNTVNLAKPSNGTAHVVYAGTNGQVHRLLASSDLFTWVPIATNTVSPSNYYEFFDHASVGQPARFYRSVSP